MKILYIYPILSKDQKLVGHDTIFFIQDLNIIKKKHDVEVFEFQYLVGYINNHQIGKLLMDVCKLFLKTYRSDVTVSWLGKLHAFFAVIFSKLLRKKSIVIAGGEEGTNVIIHGKPYGHQTTFIKRNITKVIFNLASKVLAVSKFNCDELIQNAKVSPEKVKMIYHGFNSNFYRKREGISKEPIAACIGTINIENYVRKGIKLFIEAAKYNQDMQYLVIGPAQEKDPTFEEIKNKLPENVKLLGGKYGDDLVDILSRVSVIVQASYWESFGCSVAEAMLCECVPVVRKFASLPEVVGDAGYYIKNDSLEGLTKQIKKAFESKELQKKARQRIIEQFPLEKRQEQILAILDEIL